MAAGINLIVVTLVAVPLSFIRAQSIPFFQSQLPIPVAADPPKSTSLTMFSVAISGDGLTSAAGIINVDSPESGGAVYLFSNNGSAWALQSEWINGSSTDTLFGYSCALNGDGTVLAIGAAASTAGNNSIRLYQRANNGTWNLSQQLSSTSGGILGAPVAMTDDASIIAGSSQLHELIVFRSNGTGFVQDGPPLLGAGILSPNISEADRISLSGDGNVAAIGVRSHNNYVGAIWVFSYNGSSWLPRGGMISPPASTPTLGRFGIIVRLSGDGTSFLANGVDNSGNGPCRLFLYSYVGGAYQAMQEIVVSGGATSTSYGEEFAFYHDDTRIAVTDFAANSTQGGFYVFDYNGTAWSAVSSSPILTQGNATNAGNCMAISRQHDRLVLGSVANAKTYGAVTFFEESPTLSPTRSPSRSPTPPTTPSPSRSPTPPTTPSPTSRTASPSTSGAFSLSCFSSIMVAFMAVIYVVAFG